MVVIHWQLAPFILTSQSSFDFPILLFYSFDILSFTYFANWTLLIYGFSCLILLTKAFGPFFAIFLPKFST